MEYFLYGVLFISLYIQIYLFLSLIDTSEEKKSDGKIQSSYESLSTTIIVPCYNEETTVQRTVESLLSLEYPADKLVIMIVDDGSTDNTWQVVQQYAQYPQIRLLQKENEGSKFAALNFTLQHVDTELVGVLDADSWVSPDALKNYMEFFADPEVMATIPSMVIADPDSILRRAQKAEYDVGIFARKAFDQLNAIYITPGPFSVFRKYVFDTLGPYQEAHHTEDAEIALRMQKHGYKIAYSDQSVVYTVGPKKLKSLLKQRVRWTYGFIRNMFDYREMLFNSRFKELGLIVLPIGLFRIFLAAILFPLFLWLLILPIVRFIEKVSVVGLPNWSTFNFDWYFVHVTQLQVFTFVGLLFAILSVWIGRDIIKEKKKFSIDIVYMIIMYTFIAPIWLIQSSYNALVAKKGTWR